MSRQRSHDIFPDDTPQPPSGALKSFIAAIKPERAADFIGSFNSCARRTLDAGQPVIHPASDGVSHIAELRIRQWLMLQEKERREEQRRHGLAAALGKKDENAQSGNNIAPKPPAN